MMTNKRFNIRIYGLLFNEKNQVLISDEHRYGKSFTKFPGGGLEWGEGFIDCLKREFQEELQLEIDVQELFYCTDFFIQSAFKESDQLISVYYKVKPLAAKEWDTFDLKGSASINNEQFRWLDLDTISAEDFTFPIDKLVATKLARPQKTTD